MNEILNKIGIIENPFLKEVNCEYVSTIINEIEKRIGKAGLDALFERLLKYHLDINWERKKLEQYLRKEHSWIDIFLNKAIFEIGREVVGIDNFYYYIGKISIKPSSLQTTIAKFFTIKNLFKVIEYANRNYNDVTELKVEDHTDKQNSIILRKRTKESCKNKIMKQMDDIKLFKQWMKCDCDITRGILEAIPSLFHKPHAQMIRKPKCEGLGDSSCIYHFEWESETVFERINAFIRKIITLDHHWQMKVRIRKMEATIQEKTKELSDANYELENANRDLKRMQTLLIESEKRSLEHRITGGFAHEMRNALAGAQLEFQTIFNFNQRDFSATDSIKKATFNLLKTIESFHKEYNIPREKIAKEAIPLFKEIDSILSELSISLQGIHHDIERGLSITNKIREYAKLQELKPGDTPIDIVKLFREYEHRYRQNFESIGIKYSIDNVDKAIVIADEIHLNSIFSNLINNAIDAFTDFESDRQKTIKVSVKIDQSQSIPQFIIKLSDNGSGIADKHKTEIFEPFFSTKPTSGTGLGLGIVKRLVQLYNGQIDFESSEANGTAFTITLPEHYDG